MTKMAFDDISSWADDTHKLVAKLTSSIAKSIAYKLVENSPVNTGRYVANWKLSNSRKIIIGEMSEDTDKTKSNIKGLIKSTLTPYYFLDNTSFSIYNTATYHDKVESEGWEKTPAYHPIGKTVSWAMNNFTK